MIINYHNDFMTDIENRDLYNYFIKKLSPKNKKLIHLRLHKGMSFEEIAAKEGVGKTVISNRYYKILNKLRHFV